MAHKETYTGVAPVLAPTLALPVPLAPFDVHVHAVEIDVGTAIAAALAAAVPYPLFLLQNTTFNDENVEIKTIALRK